MSSISWSSSRGNAPFRASSTAWFSAASTLRSWAPQNRELLREAQLRKVEAALNQAVEEARKGAFPMELLQDRKSVV